MSKNLTSPTDKEWKAGEVVDVTRVGWTNHNWSPHQFAYSIWFDENDEGYTPVLVTKTVNKEKVSTIGLRKGVLADHFAVVPNPRADGVLVTERPKPAAKKKAPAKKK